MPCWLVSRNVCMCACCTSETHTSLLSVKYFVILFSWFCCTAWFGFFWASFYVCVLWTVCLTALWESFMSECCLKCSSYDVVACFGANSTSKCPAWCFEETITVGPRVDSAALMGCDHNVVYIDLNEKIYILVQDNRKRRSPSIQSVHFQFLV